MFVDEATLTAKGGDGGDGCRSFRREKYVPRGGPNGGDGGKGGDLILVAEAGLTTLIALRYRNLLRADRGRHGMGANKTGRCGNDMLVKVPIGTVIFDEDKLQLLADLNAPGDQFIAAAGGRGGRGNARFSSSVNRAPTRFDTGEPGQQRVLKLELKLLANLGHNIIEHYRLDYIIAGPQSDRFDGHFDRTISRNHNHPHRRLGPHDFA